MNIHLASNISSVNVNDSLIYDLSIKAAQTVVQEYYVNQFISLNLILNLSVVRIYSDKMDARISFVVNKYDYKVYTNSTDKESIERTLGLNVKEFVKEINSTSLTYSIPLTNITNIMAYIPFEVLNLLGGFKPEGVQLFNADVEMVSYMGRRALYVKTLIGLTQEAGSAIGSIENYLDMASGIPLTMLFSMKIKLVPTKTASYEFSMEISAKLMNPDVLNKSVMRVYRVQFINNTSSITLSCENLSVELLTSEGRSLRMRISGSGYGVILIQTPKEIIVEDVYLDGSKVGFVAINSDKARVVLIPVAFSTREVVVYFNQNIESVQEVQERALKGSRDSGVATIELGRESGEKFIRLLPIIMVAAVIVAVTSLIVVAFILKKASKPP